MTSMGEMSAAIITMADGSVMSEDEGADEGDLRRALTTSLTPRRSVFVLAAEGRKCVRDGGSNG